ncbi:transposase [Saccharothrix syringae]|uniref:transposase n=2 Tax=Saccharothrix syringae TaxID=103733 RepID=UPI001D1732F9|nr:transposase [Saccharothrix syringae]
MFEPAEAMLYADGPVRSPAELSLVGERRRGHGSVYAALARGEVDTEGHHRLAASGSPHLAAADPVPHLRAEQGSARDGPGWPCSIVVALKTGRGSWTAPLDAVRLAPGDDAATVTAAQLRRVVGALVEFGHHRPDDPDILIVADAGYDGPRLAFLLAGLPVAVLVRMRSDRVLRRATLPRPPGTWGRPRRHGDEFVFGDPAARGTPQVRSRTRIRLYALARVRARDRLHPRLPHRSAWAAGEDGLPIIEGAVIRLQVQRLPSGAIPKPVWLWHSNVDLDTGEVDRCWQAFLRRFDIEHTFRMLKQTLGRTHPKIHDP